MGRRLTAFTDLDEELEAFANVQLVGVTEVGERLTVDVLEHQEGLTAVGLTSVENLGDVGVTHARQGPTLLAESFGMPAAAVSVQELQRDLSLDGLDLLGVVHDAHAAAADLFDDPVAPDLYGRLHRTGLADHHACQGRFGLGGRGHHGRRFRSAHRFSGERDVQKLYQAPTPSP